MKKDSLAVVSATFATSYSTWKLDISLPLCSCSYSHFKVIALMHLKMNDFHHGILK